MSCTNGVGRIWEKSGGVEDVMDDNYMRWEVVDELDANATNVVQSAKSVL